MKKKFEKGAYKKGIDENVYRFLGLKINKYGSNQPEKHTRAQTHTQIKKPYLGILVDLC